MNSKRSEIKKIESKISMLTKQINHLESTVKIILTGIKQSTIVSEKTDKENDEKSQFEKCDLDKDIKKQLTELEKRIIKLEESDKKYIELKNQINNLEQKIDSINDSEKDEKKQQIDFNPIISNAIEKENKIYNKDFLEFNKLIENIKYWEKIGKQIYSDISDKEPLLNEFINKGANILNKFPVEIKEQLQTKQDGLNIIGRMIRRLFDSGGLLTNISETISFEESLKEPLSNQNWLEILKNCSTLSDAQEKIDKLLEKYENNNYKIVYSNNELSKNCEKNISSFMNKKFLPIIDAVYEGKKHCSRHSKGISNSHNGNYAYEVQEWFRIYSDITDKLESILIKVGIEKIEVSVGDFIDFNLHEPFTVEPQPDMENEQIKEIIKQGFEYKMPDGSKKILRPTQVVVVKNISNKE